MNIKINERWSIGSDANQFILYKTIVAKSGKKIGETVKTPDGYYIKLEHLLDRLIDKILYKSEAKTIEELRVDIERAKEIIRPFYEKGLE